MGVTVPVIDPLDRGDAATLGDEWTAAPFVDGAVMPQLLGEQVAAAVGSGYSSAWFNAVTIDSADGVVEAAARIATLPPNGGIAVVSLVQSPGTGGAKGYGAAVPINTGGNETVALEKYGPFSTLDTDASVDWAGGDTLAIRLDDSDISIVNVRGGTETPILTVTDGAAYSGEFQFALWLASDSGSVGRFDLPRFGIKGASPASGLVLRRGGEWVAATRSTRVDGEWA